MVLVTNSPNSVPRCRPVRVVVAAVMWCCWLEVLPEVPIARVAAAAAAAAAMMLVARTPAHPCAWW